MSFRLRLTSSGPAVFFSAFGALFRFSGLGSRASHRPSSFGRGGSSPGFRVSNLDSRISSFWSRVPDLRYRVSGLKFLASGLWFQVSGFGISQPDIIRPCSLESFIDKPHAPLSQFMWAHHVAPPMLFFIPKSTNLCRKTGVST